MKIKTIVLLALASVLCLCAFCTAACDGGAGEEQTTAAADAQVTYQVKVMDANGAPVAGVAVQFCDDNGCRMPMNTNAEGIVTLTEAASNFHVTLVSVPAGFAPDATEYDFDGATELTVTLQAE
jgi:hypothetical protein